MENRRQTLGFLLWLFLLQVLAEGVGFWVILTFVGWFDSEPEAFFLYGWTMLPLWFLWGLVTPKKLRPTQGRPWRVLGLWTAFLAALVLLFPDGHMVVTLPQLGVGEAMAQLWPGSHRSAAFQRQVLPVFTALAHGLLPLLLGMGMKLGDRTR